MRFSVEEISVKKKAHHDLLFVIKVGWNTKWQGRSWKLWLSHSRLFYYKSGYGFNRHYIRIKNSGIDYSCQHDSKIIDTDVNADEVSLIWSREGHAESLYG